MYFAILYNPIYCGPSQTSRVKGRLDELSATVRYSVDPARLLGAPVLRHLEGVGSFPGTVIEHDALTGFRVHYSDGETEDVSLRELQTMLLRRGASINSAPISSTADAQDASVHGGCQSLVLSAGALAGLELRDDLTVCHQSFTSR